MSENIIITDRKSAVALVKYERDRSRVVYSAYIDANAVTLDSVSDHVKALAEIAFPTFQKGGDAEVSANRKAFMNRVRNGLNHTLCKWESDAAAKQASAETESAEDDSPETSQDNAPAVPSTADLISTAEDIVRALVQRAYADDADATVGLQSIASAIDAAMPHPATVLVNAA